MFFSELDILVYTSICIVYALFKFKFFTTPQVHFESYDSSRLAPPTSLNSTLMSHDFHACELASFLQLPQVPLN